LGVILADALFFVIAYLAAIVLRFDGLPGPAWLPLLLRVLPAVVGIQMLAFWLLRLHRHSWRYVSFADLMQMGRAAVVSGTVVFLALALPLRHFGHGFPRSVVFIDSALILLLCGGARFAARLRFQAFRSAPGPLKRAAVLGAGSAADSVLREMLSRPELGYQPVCLLDDSESKIGRSLHGLRIHGPIEELGKLAKKRGVEEVIIAIPAATRAQMQRIMEIVSQTGLPSKTVPAMGDLINGTVSVSRLRRLEIADLLNREQVSIDLEAVAGYLQGRRVLVTGAGGAIGTELCRQVLQLGPELLILMGRGENSLYEAHRKLRAGFPEAPLQVVQSDIVNRQKLDRVLAQLRPQVVFHAAANKHVPLSEINPDETLLSNVVGTWNVLESAAANGVQRVVCISTDKAVEPSGIMGASKRLAEFLVLGAEYPRTICTSVRFGNVLGSRGSVVPLFQEQIAKGEAVTVTDPDMTRYFMTVSEAAQLVLQAGAFSRGNDLFVLEMGEPIKIADLAKQMIRLSGLRPEVDIPIRIVGRRPSEKLHEALLNEGEQWESTPHPKIRRIVSPPSPRLLPEDIEQLYQLCRDGEPEALRCWLAERIPSLAHPEPESFRVAFSDDVPGTD
jgi:FlaA1/EpsC-like NDP-sugar epimerase